MPPPPPAGRGIISRKSARRSEGAEGHRGQGAADMGDVEQPVRQEAADILVLGDIDLGQQVVIARGRIKFADDLAVIDRLGNMKKTKQVANMLGIPNFIQQISKDDYRLEDIRIIVGKDYKRLRLLE